MVDTIFILKSPLCNNSRFWEGLRITAAFVGMDHLPLILFIDDALDAVKKRSWESLSYWEYLKTSSDLAGLFVFDINLKKNNLKLTDLDPDLNINSIDLNELTKLISEAKLVSTF